MRCIGISATGARAIAQTGGHSGDGRGGTEPSQRLASARALADALGDLTLTLPDPVSEQRIAADVQTIQRMVSAAPVFVSIPPPLPAPTPPPSERRSVAPPADRTEAIALVRRVDRG